LFRKLSVRTGLKSVQRRKETDLVAAVVPPRDAVVHLEAAKQRRFAASQRAQQNDRPIVFGFC
jgi:hypothetical protein